MVAVAVQILFYRNTHDQKTGEFRVELDKYKSLLVTHALEHAIPRSFSETVSWIRSYEEQFNDKPMTLAEIVEEIRMGLETTAIRAEEVPSPSGE